MRPGHAPREDEQAAMDARFSAYLIKPIRFAALLEALSGATGG